MLCTWTRSITGLPIRWKDVSSCWRAASGSADPPPAAATFSLVAQNSFFAIPSSCAIRPATSSEAP